MAIFDRTSIYLYILTLHVSIISYVMFKYEISDIVENIMKTFWKMENPDTDRSNMMYGEFVERLGHNLFQFCSLIGIAHQNKRSLAFINESPLLKMFKIDSKWKNVRQNYKIHETITEKELGIFDESLFEIKNPNNVKIQHFLQSYKYFEPILPYIKQQLVLNDEYNNLVDDYLMSIKRLINYQQTLFVGIHIRRGDIDELQRIYNLPT